MSREELKAKALNLALARLATREYSARELEMYLERKEIPAEIAADAVAQLKEEHLQDDRRYALEMTRGQAMREKGPDYILQKLRQKGLNIEMTEVRELFGETSGRSELEMARHLVERRYPRAEKDEKEFRRAYAALIRRGFSSEVTRKALFGRAPEEAENSGDG